MRPKLREWVVAQVEPELSAVHCAKGLHNLSSQFRSAPLTPSNLQLCARLAERLVRERSRGQFASATLFLPDEQSVLRPGASLYYIESSAAGWLKPEDVAATMHRLNYVIPEETARALGVASLREIHQVPFPPKFNLSLKNLSCIRFLFFQKLEVPFKLLQTDKMTQSAKSNFPSRNTFYFEKWLSTSNFSTNGLDKSLSQVKFAFKIPFLFKIRHSLSTSPPLDYIIHSAMSNLPSRNTFLFKIISSLQLFPHWLDNHISQVKPAFRIPFLFKVRHSL